MQGMNLDEFRAAEELRRHAAAMRLQAAWRGIASRKAAKVLAMQAHAMRQHSAAICIQVAFHDLGSCTSDSMHAHT